MKLTKSDIEQGYGILKEVIDHYIETHNIAFISSEIAPSTFEGMKAYYYDFGKFLVFSGGDHGYLGQEYNIKFRAVHDFMHLKYKLSFKFEDEKVLSGKTEADFGLIACYTLNKTASECHLLMAIIDAEIKGQIEYYEKNKEYVKDQREFINDYLKAA